MRITFKYILLAGLAAHSIYGYSQGLCGGSGYMGSQCQKFQTDYAQCFGNYGSSTCSSSLNSINYISGTNGSGTQSAYVGDLSCPLDPGKSGCATDYCFYVPVDDASCCSNLGETCSVDSDCCGTSMVCSSSGLCMPKCSTNGDCPSGQICGAGGHCGCNTICDSTSCPGYDALTCGCAANSCYDTLCPGYDDLACNCPSNPCYSTSCSNYSMCEPPCVNDYDPCDPYSCQQSDEACEEQCEEDCICDYLTLPGAKLRPDLDPNLTPPAGTNGVSRPLNECGGDIISSSESLSVESPDLTSVALRLHIANEPTFGGM
jgi:hypothetical protein